VRRFRDRLIDPLKRWKLSYEDFRNRARWSEYETAIEDMMAQTATKAAPWYLIPADNKAYGRIAALRILVDRLGKNVSLEPRPIDPGLLREAKRTLRLSASEARLPARQAEGQAEAERIGELRCRRVRACTGARDFPVGRRIKSSQAVTFSLNLDVSIAIFPFGNIYERLSMENDESAVDRGASEAALAFGSFIRRRRKASGSACIGGRCRPQVSDRPGSRQAFLPAWTKPPGR
jgi:Polyphosphate kinase 2 (PPK2)